MLTNARKTTVPLKGDRLDCSGTQTCRIDGQGIEGGTLTVTWSPATQ
jgi:hypothetical protein